MIRTEAIAVPAVRTDPPQLYDLHALVWNPDAPENAISRYALVRAELEFADGRHGTLSLRPGVPYSSSQRITRAWLTTTAAFGGLVAAIEVGYEAGAALGSSQPVSPSTAAAIVQVLNGPTGSLVIGQSVIKATRPAAAEGRRRLALLQVSGDRVGPAFVIRYGNPLVEAYRSPNYTPIAAVPGILLLFGYQTGPLALSASGFITAHSSGLNVPWAAPDEVEILVGAATTVVTASVFHAIWET
jgi:hypothetical protein